MDDIRGKRADLAVLDDLVSLDDETVLKDWVFNEPRAEGRADFVGPRLPDVLMLGMDFSGLEDRVLEAYQAASRDGVAMLYVAYFDGHFSSKTQMMSDMMLELIDPTPIGPLYDLRPAQTWPRAPRAVPGRVQSAPRQSFRRIMRSVNRNR